MHHATNETRALNRISSRISNVCRRPVTCSENNLATSFHAPLKRASAAMRLLLYCVSLFLLYSAFSLFYDVDLSLFYAVALSLFCTMPLSTHTGVGKRQKNVTKRGQRRERSENVSGRELRAIRQRDIRQRDIRQRGLRRVAERP